jgi:hypothetical protein
MMTAPLYDIVDTERHPLSDEAYRAECRGIIARTGALVLREFLKPEAVAAIRREGEDNEHLAFYSTQAHNVYLAPPDSDYADDHPRNRAIASSKGCITDDIVPADSPLRVLYDAPTFREFLCTVLDETSLHGYADPLSSINLHYAKPGQELGWHFDNSSFAITLMIQPPERGGAFEYVGAVRDADRGERRFEAVARVLDGEVEPQVLAIDAGALVLFRGRDAIHRVTPVEGTRTRMLVVLAYNAEPSVSLSESARMTFYGRLQ